MIKVFSANYLEKIAQIFAKIFIDKQFGESEQQEKPSCRRTG